MPVQLGCTSSACPFPKTSALTFTPQIPTCLQTKLSACARATVEMNNGCSDALYVPVDYGIFAEQVQPGTELEVRSLQNLVYEIRTEKAKSRTSSQEDYEIPFRIGKDTYTMTFSIYSDS
ncbi:hypothetical protein LVJ94_05015 [Pendulispora rubella]|uniref:Uncharacterized protein n=1 Tax=Pendulispora rubella TaxID=2741070 RepID=A0ABZ2L6P7_9BACT